MIGDELLKLRQEMKLSQQQLADGASVGRSIISLVESGKRTPNIEAVRRLAKFLNAPEETQNRWLDEAREFFGLTPLQRRAKDFTWFIVSHPELLRALASTSGCDGYKEGVERAIKTVLAQGKLKKEDRPNFSQENWESIILHPLKKS